MNSNSNIIITTDNNNSNNNQTKVMVVDTFHLFPKTIEFLKEVEEFYKVRAKVFCIEGIAVGNKVA